MTDTKYRTSHLVKEILKDFERLSHFAQVLESQILSEWKDKSSDAGLNQKNQEIIVREKSIWHFDEEMPYMLRGAVLLSSMGFLEHNLSVVCDYLCQVTRHEVALTDLNGRGLKRAKHYLQKEIGIPFPSRTESWRYILKVAEVRNLLAHRDAQLKEGNPELQRFILAGDEYFVDESQRVKLKGTALSKLIQVMQTFFSELYSEVHAFENTKITGTPN